MWGKTEFDYIIFFLYFFRKLKVHYLIDGSSQHGALAGRPLEPLAGGWKGGESNAPAVAVASGPKAPPPRLLKSGHTWPSDALRPVYFMIAFDCSAQTQPAGGLLPDFDLPFGSGQTLGACAVQLEKQI